MPTYIDALDPLPTDIPNKLPESERISFEEYIAIYGVSKHRICPADYGQDIFNCLWYLTKTEWLRYSNGKHNHIEYPTKAIALEYLAVALYNLKITRSQLFHAIYDECPECKCNTKVVHEGLFKNDKS